jgi:hypothetical protein
MIPLGRLPDVPQHILSISFGQIQVENNQSRAGCGSRIECFNKLDCLLAIVHYDELGCYLKLLESLFHEQHIPRVIFY